MTIRPVDLNGMMQRTQEVGTLKAHEDNRPMTEQQNLAATFDKKLEHETHKINKADQSQKEEEKFDAREEGKGQYFSQGQKNKKKEETGKVINKNMPTGGFDIKI